jgi:hypothetical protein
LEIDRRGYKVIALWTRGIEEAAKSDNSSNVFGTITYLAEVDQQETLKETKNILDGIAASCNNNSKNLACLVGGDWGFHTQMLCPHTWDCEPIQRKYLIVMISIFNKNWLKIQVVGIDQMIGTKFLEVELFLNDATYPVVAKPANVSTSYGVKR